MIFPTGKAIEDDFFFCLFSPAPFLLTLPLVCDLLSTPPSLPSLCVLGWWTAFPWGHSLGLRFPVRHCDFPVLPGGGLRGSVHEENILQEDAAVLHSSGYRDSLLQRSIPTHSWGTVLRRSACFCLKRSNTRQMPGFLLCAPLLKKHTVLASSSTDFIGDS